ncbi:MAG: type ISP restriction/modification enzyme [Candidatus Paceibacterota bacterium]
MDNYLQEIQKYFKDVNSSEMSYRTPFQNFLETIFKREDKFLVQHDQKSINGNKPDFIVLKNNVPVLYIEVKKVGEDLDKIEKSNQADRYYGYDNLIISDYVNFRFYRYGKKYEEEISLGDIDKKDKIITENSKTEFLTQTILDFANSHKEEIKAGEHLAKIMGAKASRIKENVFYMLSSENERFAEILKIREVIKENLISSLSDEDFADMYAQTLVYGLFAARYNDKTKESFSRYEAIELAPKTNPFLKRFFGHIAGESFPDRLRFIVDELCEVFTHADVHKLLTNFYGKEKDTKDPIIHFYEDFLREYDSKKKMEMGVFYTPKPVVDFIIRGVDFLLKNEFGISGGLADKTKIKLKKKINDIKTGKEKEIEEEYHRVQILDVATGTGTFLNQTISFIYNEFKNKGQLGSWESYVNEHLLPRLHGFELMMASYTIAHLKLGMTLQDTGIDMNKLDKRLGVYLTNTLEEAKVFETQPSMFGFMDSITEESKGASRVKREYPIMCVIGNPPYSGISQNKSYTDNNVYKVEPGGKMKLQERKHWLDDDYVKFIRFGESLIEKNQEGILGMITAHGYIDNPTFRGMRWHLRNTFDNIYILDLHGNSNKKEISPDGNKDENIFDIKTGVSIMFGIKKGNVENKKLSNIYKFDLYGLREEKFNTLEQANFESIGWQLLAGNDLWILEGKGKSEYIEGFSVVEIFSRNTSGIVTANDKLSIFETKEELEKNTKAILNSNDPYKEFNIKDGRRTKKEARVAELRESFEKNKVTPISYRPFDTRYMYYTTGSEVWINSPRPEIMQNLINQDNIGIVFRRAVHKDIYGLTFLVKTIIRADNYGDFSSLPQFAPLYLYTDQNEKISNLNKEIWEKINEVVGETSPENILDYIYAVLHSPKYRETYKEFLKIDFPRVPYPTGKKEFDRLVVLGEKLRSLHLMTDSRVNDFITTYSVAGENLVEKLKYENGNVYINKDQHFGNVPEIAWNFYIGGYQPAQKYLKDRKGRNLTNDEIENYQKIIKVLFETDKVMKEIDK